MAFQTGPITLKGTIGGISFYKSVYGNLARSKGGPSRKQFLSAPEFARSRENSEEFRHCALLTKKAWAAVRQFDPRNKKLYGRLMKLMCALRKCDKTGLRGKRTVYGGLLTATGKQLLKQCALQEDKELNAILVKELGLFLAREEMREAAGRKPARLIRKEDAPEKKITLRTKTQKPRYAPRTLALSAQGKKRKKGAAVKRRT